MTTTTEDRVNIEITLKCDDCGYETEETAINVQINEFEQLEYLVTSGWHFCERCESNNWEPERMLSSRRYGEAQVLKAYLELVDSVQGTRIKENFRWSDWGIDTDPKYLIPSVDFWERFERS